ncbi:MAG: GAF domain-containing protein [Chloroherpetonaceae bacterium]|nr:GAF domain-containing protein [Chloroherpetonaceae bacterium]MCS7210551.1 GAF domain-containing protein [Chloroherpetonaceae bacterium]MDW8019553.1 GAF domain-containing protein [Chloroherpetonaceae bacterium]MDW8467197.1 GAF domain-containing protein [Chloroherpetonaceae bacterium]
MMFELTDTSNLTKTDLYKTLTMQLYHLLEGEHDFIANAANFSALLYHTMPDLNWAGIYLYKQGELVLGPFQGKPACTRIALGKGVCGTAAERKKTIIVPNVHEFPGHIACDSASNSEIVVPMIRSGQLIGVLDLDSPLLARFDEEDKAGLENLVEVFLASTLGQQQTS